MSYSNRPGQAPLLCVPVYFCNSLFHHHCCCCCCCWCFCRHPPVQCQPRLVSWISAAWTHWQHCLPHAHSWCWTGVYVCVDEGVTLQQKNSWNVDVPSTGQCVGVVCKRIVCGRQLLFCYFELLCISKAPRFSCRSCPGQPVLAVVQSWFVICASEVLALCVQRMPSKDYQ